MDIFKDFGIAIWLKNGAPAHKLVLGIPLFARTFLLAHMDQNKLHSPTIGNGTEGVFTRSAGFLSYFEVNLLYRIHFFYVVEFRKGMSTTNRSSMETKYYIRWIRIGIYV
jgi:hypothetical protein